MGWLEADCINKNIGDKMRRWLSVLLLFCCGWMDAVAQCLDSTDINAYHFLYRDTLCSGNDYHRYGFNLARQDSVGWFTYTEHFTTVQGCDSVRVLQLLVMGTPILATLAQPSEICAGQSVVVHALGENSEVVVNPPSIVYDTTLTYQWNTGSTQPYITVFPTQTTTYTVTATTDYGCSATTEHIVIVGTGVSQIIHDTLCQGAGYEGYGFSLTAEETSTVCDLVRSRPLNTEGCGSPLTLWLTIKPVKTSTFSAVVYESYTWNGITYYESGSYTQTFTAANGCDSVVTLELTIAGKIDIISSADTICLGDSVVMQANVTTLSIPEIRTPPIAVGDILCTDSSIVKPSSWPVAGKTAMGIVFYVDTTNEHGWAVHLHDQASHIQWSSNHGNLPCLTGYSYARNAIYDLNGYANTECIRAAGDSSTYPAAYSVDIANGWYLPAAGQLCLLYPKMVTINASLQIVGGTPFPMDNYYYYWSSTKTGSTCANCAYALHNDGDLEKWATYHDFFNVRSVRTF